MANKYVLCLIVAGLVHCTFAPAGAQSIQKYNAGDTIRLRIALTNSAGDTLKEWSGSTESVLLHLN